jgi:glutathione S-transferase
MDIVDFLDARWPQPALVPADATARDLMERLIEQGKALHVSVRYVSFHWGLGRLGRIGAAEEATIASLERSDSPEQLLAFYQRYNRGTIDEGTFLGHLAALEAGWGEQEDRLRGDGRPYLTGAQFSRADILWAVKMQRIVECGYPFAARFPQLHAWYRRMQARPGFRQGVLGPNLATHYIFRFKAAVENLLGMGIARAAGVKA